MDPYIIPIYAFFDVKNQTANLGAFLHYNDEELVGEMKTKAIDKAKKIIEVFSQKNHEENKILQFKQLAAFRKSLILSKSII